MKLTEKQIIKLKTKLAIHGTGSKTKLASELNLFSTQITLLCKDGYCPEHASKKLLKWLNS